MANSDDFDEINRKNHPELFKDPNAHYSGNLDRFGYTAEDVKYLIANKKTIDMSDPVEIEKLRRLQVQFGVIKEGDPVKITRGIDLFEDSSATDTKPALPVPLPFRK